MNETSNYLYWFYSTSTQSLAALIGIVGVFAIARIQLLVNIVKNKTDDLQQYVNTERWQALGVLNPAQVKEDIFVSIKKIKDSLSNNVAQYENMIQQHIRNSQNNKQDYSNQINQLNTSKSDLENRIDILEKQEKEINSLRSLKTEVANSTRIVIGSLMVLLVGSIICLSLVEVISKSTFLCQAIVTTTVILLLGALYLLSRLCWISLQMDTD